MGKKVNWFLFLAIIPVMMLFLSGLSLFDRGAVVFPNKVYQIGIYSDTFSEVSNFHADNKRAELEYMLKKGVRYPSIGIYVNVLEPDNNVYMDLSSYKYLKIRISTTTSKDLRIFLLLFINNFTKSVNYQSFRYLEHTISLGRESKEYTFPLDSFVTPLWWYNANNTSEEEIGKPDFTKLARIQIENGLLLQPEIKDKIILEHMAFKRSYSVLYLVTALVVVLFTAVFFTGIIIRKNQKTVITYKPLEVENLQDNEMKRVVSYITSNYSNPDLAIETIYSETGIVPAKISVLIKKGYNLSFKQFLNNIRLAEAKRLLSETNNQIIEIAFKVGYNTVSHFNRLFKKVENLSPKEYRRLHRK